MNYLQLCQKVARESGTISGTAPSAVTNQTGRLLKIVNYVNDAWLAIQNHRNAWQWMRAEFSDKVTIAGTARYTATGWDLTRFRAWVIDNPATGYQPLSLYKQSEGVSSEGPINFISWQLWRGRYGRGSPATDSTYRNQPSEYSVSPALELCLGPIPDAVYVVRGEYRKSAQTLSANDDTPEMPADFHDLIVQYALELLAGHDEAPAAFANSKAAKSVIYANLEREQLPPIDAWAGGPLA